MHAHIVLLLGAVLVRPSAAVWSCARDEECAALGGGVCAAGACVCPPAQEPVLGGTLCVDRAPYHQSACVQDQQCARLVTSYRCAEREDGESVCLCQAGHHYWSGRCWPTTAFGEACAADEQCLGTPRDPYSLRCDGTCACADGYYLRQRGECRKIATAVGERCVLDEDCQFAAGACDAASFTCYSTTDARTRTVHHAANVTELAAMLSRKMVRQHGAACDAASPCPGDFECSAGACVCPRGYYGSEDGASCLAELGSPSTAAQCGGLLAEVVDGRCVCPANFFYEDNMRDCVKVTRRIDESCVSDANCHTFGAASRCGPAREPWGFRYCECVPEDAVWDAARHMCRLFAGVGEPCEEDSDCLAGELEVQCRRDEAGRGACACPDHLAELDGLCLTAGLVLGDACQHTAECTGAEHAACTAGVCACADGFVADEENSFCAPIIGGACAADADCVIEHTVCANSTDSDARTCRCGDLFVQHDDACWPLLSEDSRSCSVAAQCAAVLGDSSACDDGVCVCGDGHHERDGRCWPITELFASCSRSSECFLREGSERAVCRNGLCQCDFQHPYSEDSGTCTSGAAAVAGGVLLLMAALLATWH